MRTEARAIQLAVASSIEKSIPEVSMPMTSSHAIIPAASVSFSSTTDLICRYVAFASLSLGGLLWDLWSKWSVFNMLGCPGVQPIWKGSLLGISTKFDLATTFNHGALWGIGQNQTWIFASLSVLAVGVMSYFLWNRQAIASWWLTIATGLLLAGTLGNLYDRLGLHGWRDANGAVYAVRDFLDFVFLDGKFQWATFNFADMYLVTGAIMLVLQSFWSPVEKARVD